MRQAQRHAPGKWHKKTYKKRLCYLAQSLVVEKAFSTTSE